MIRRVLFLVFSVFTLLAANAQVTTSGLLGSVKSDKKENLTGATIKAVHVPSGTIYTAVATADGRFNMPNMRVGGPYSVTVSFVGFNARTFDNLFLELGAPLKLDAVLEDNSKTMSEVTVSYRKNPIINPQRQGPATQVSQTQLATLPTITRNIDDFTRLDPRANARKSGTDGSTLGVSFAGSSNKYNQFTIDGANATDIFGLASSGTNGGQASLNPIPFDAIEQVQIVLAPYDVTLSGFTGGGVNAVTRSGTNEFHGSIYGFNQNQGLVGKSADTRAKYGTFHDNQYGARLGGAIIKNKLFFFVNYEGESRSQPPINLPGTSGSQIKDLTTLDQLSAFLKDASKHPGWSYDPGAYNGFNNEKKSNAIFARVDWNIDNKNKLTIRNSWVKGHNFIFSDGANSMSYYNNGYNFNSRTNSTVLELNSSISTKVSNMLRATYTNTKDARATPGALFPAVSISDNGATYAFGTEFSSQANSLDQRILTITDNVNLYAGKHTFTFGTDNQFYNSKNVFLQGLVGSYTYSNLQAFYADVQGIDSFANKYQTVYSTDPKNPKPVANVSAYQLGFYAQDAYSVLDNLNVTLGVRADIPVFSSKPTDNPAFNTSPIAIANGVATNKIPTTKILISPRVGFNWDVFGDKKTQVRGGVGLFTGRVPFVWISNQYSNTGIGTISSTLTPAQIASNNVHFNPNAPFHPATGVGPAINLTDPNFKYVRTLRSNLAIDQRLPWGIIGTLEGIYTKTIEDILYKDINLAPSTTTINLGNTTRPWYNSNKVNAAYSNLYTLTNTTLGYSYNVSLMLSKLFNNGWFASAAYSLGHSYGANDGGSSTAASQYRFAYNINGTNNLDEARNNYDLGSRVVVNIGKKFKYGHGRFYTNVGLVYIGQSGQPFSYVFFGDLNGDDGSTAAKASTSGGADLMYLPTDASQFAATKTFKINGVNQTFTAAQQFAAFQTYENSTSYLRNHLGQNTSRNGDRLPFEHHFDLKVEEGVAVYKQHTISITATIFNFSNLLNKDWGRSYFLSNQEAQPLNVDHFNTNANGTVTPIWYYNPAFGLNQYTNKPWQYSDFLSRWNMQLGVRYTF